MLAIYIDSIGDKSATYKLLRNFSSLPLSLIQSRIKNHDTVMEVDILDLDDRELIGQLTAIGTVVTIKNSTGIITLEILSNIINTYEEIAVEREELDALMLDEEE